MNILPDGKIGCDHIKNYIQCTQMATNHILDMGFNYCDAHLPGEHVGRVIGAQNAVIHSEEGFQPC